MVTSHDVVTSNPTLQLLQQWAGKAVTPLTLLFFSAILGTVVKWTRRPSSTTLLLPPCPSGALPLLGHMHLLAREPDIRVTLSKLREKLGDIFFFYAGSRVILVLNGYDLIREALVKNAAMFSHRPLTFMSQQIAKGKGLLNTSGNHWREQRHFTERALKSLGSDSNSAMAAKIQEGVDSLLSKLEEARCQGQPVEPGPLLMRAFSNVIISILYGHSFDMDDPAFCSLMTALNNCFEFFGNTETLNVLPAVRFLPGDPFHYWFCLHNANDVEGLLAYPEVARHERSLHDDSGAEADDVVSAYLREMEKKGALGAPTTMDRENLVKVAGDLLAAGTEAPYTTVHWFLLYMVRFPQVQENCYQEILSTLGPERAPTLEDRGSLPYLEATLMEVQRHADVGPLSMAHGLARETQLRGYRIPADAIVLINIHSVLHDPLFWVDPEVFRPERFLEETEEEKEGPEDEKGRAGGGNKKLVVKRPPQFVPYSLGPRVCPGEHMARLEMFLFLSSILQKYHLSHHGSSPPSLQGKFSLLHKPHPFRISLELRQQEQQSSCCGCNEE